MEAGNQMSAYEVIIILLLLISLVFLLIRNFYFLYLWNCIYKKGQLSELSYLFPSGMKKFMREINISTNEMEREYVEIIKKINIFSLLFQFGLAIAVIWGFFGSIFI
jgi:hypothetical protein